MILFFKLFVKKRLRKFFSVGALYNVVDQIFIANANYLDSYGNAANTVVFPLTVVALAIAVISIAYTYKELNGKEKN